MDNIVIQAVRETCDTSLVPLTRPVVKQFFPSETSEDEKDSNQSKKDEHSDSKDEAIRDNVSAETVRSQPVQSEGEIDNQQTLCEETVSQDETVAIHPETPECVIESPKESDVKEETSSLESEDELQSIDADNPEESKADRQDLSSAVEESPSPKDTDTVWSHDETDAQVDVADQPLVVSCEEKDDNTESVVIVCADEMPDETMSIEPSEEALSEVRGRPVKRRRSSRSLLIEQSQDTISSRTRSKDSSPVKSVGVLPPKKRARKSQQI